MLLFNTPPWTLSGDSNASGLQSSRVPQGGFPNKVSHNCALWRC